MTTTPQPPVGPLPSGQAASADCLAALGLIPGEGGILTDPGEMAPYLTDWTGRHVGQALAVLRPGSTREVSAIMAACAARGVAVTVQGGNTGLAGGAVPVAGCAHVLLSLGRMRRIHRVDVMARCATVDAGVILQTLQERVAKDGLSYPLMFGARGSCTIGGTLATNAGGANVLRHGNARAQCLGIEAVLPDGRVISDLDGLRKDNTGYDLRDLLIGSEGTLGVITAATLRLQPAPVAVTTAFLALRGIDDALPVLNALQDCSGGLVEAFEYMPASLVTRICHHLGARPPLATPAQAGILLELASTRPSDRGEAGLDHLVQTALAALIDNGAILDAVMARSGAQRQEMWRLRESTAEAIMALDGVQILDLSLPLSAIPGFITQTDAQTQAAGFRILTVGHLGCGNLHYAFAPEAGDPARIAQAEALKDEILDQVAALGGSFSAEHGIGQDKLALMTRYRSPERLSAMRQIRQALDPQGILNPGKTIPPAPQAPASAGR